MKTTSPTVLSRKSETETISQHKKNALLGLISDRPIVQIDLNFDLLLCFGFLWVYGFYASIAFEAPVANNLVDLILCSIMVVLVELAARHRVTRVTVTRRDVALFLTYLGICLGFGYREVTDSIVNDHFYHLQLAMAHAMRLLAPDVLADSSWVGAHIQEIPYKYILAGTNLAIIVALVSAFYLSCFRPRNRVLRCILTTVLFLGLRWIVGRYVTRGDIHPPLRLAVLNFATIFLGINNFAMRVPGLIATGVVVCFIARRTRNKLGDAGAMSLALVFGTVPLLWHVATIVEASIWSTLAFSVLLLELIVRPTVENHANIDGDNLRGLYVLVGLAALMRQSAFIAVVTLGVGHFVSLIRTYRHTADTKPPDKQSSHTGSKFWELLPKTIGVAYPLLVMIPWTLYIAYTGTPATDRSGISIFTKISQAFIDAAAIRYLYFHLGAIWFGFFLVGLISWTNIQLLTTLQAALGILLFYSVAPPLWGLARYQAEIGLPVVCIGVVSFFVVTVDLLRSQRRQSKSQYILLMLMVLVGSNIWMFKKIHEVKNPVDADSFFTRSRDGSIRGLAELPYDFDKAMADIKAQGLSSDLYIDGTVYGPFPHILAGYEFATVRRNMNLGPVWTGVDPYLLDSAKMVRAALFADWGEIKTQKSIGILRERGWEIKQRYPHFAATDNILYLLIRR